ncbi:hypothetical protein VIGAN_07121400 [Vigna angularis var. angularis]|uniref:Uncharacterized protein n=1 Tax=Vigna angularis var. angularis TaxID=157739 RepID=A0A0S3SHZ7_PHAAN|nr:hypothetical protein VIGAN_07121400 [Vigna angularis var. angularis]
MDSPTLTSTTSSTEMDSPTLTSNADERLSPKFQFLRSKGASVSDIVHLVNRCPRILVSSLKNNVIPSFELVRIEKIERRQWVI